MRRPGTALACLAAGAALAAPGTVHAAVPEPTAQAKLSECRTGSSPTSRTATFDATMRSLRRGDRLEVRYDLLQRRPIDERFRRVAAPGLGEWVMADRGTTLYRFHKVVQNLEAPAEYRARVRFRWRTSAGRTFRTARRLTAACRQPDLRPDLRIGRVGVQRLGGGVWRYVAVIRNEGRTTAPDFDVVVAVDGVDQPASTVTGLLAFATTTVAVEAPRCRPDGSFTVTVDPDERVAERDEGNGRRVFPCP